MKRVTLFAMTQKGLETIKSVHRVNPTLIAKVISARDKGIAEDCYEGIRDFCSGENIALFDRHDSFRVETEYSIAVSWRWLIEVNSSSLIVIHDSLLPRHRGFNPLVTALINGDREIGVTALYGTEEFDRGDIIMKSATPIEYPITIAEAINIILGNYKCVAENLASLLIRDQHPAATPQDESAASYSLWRDEHDYFIDWSLSAQVVRRSVDALGYPYKGAATKANGTHFRVVRATELPDVKIENRTPGKVIFLQDSKPIVVCGTGLLRIDELVDDSGASALPLPRFRTRFE